MIKPNGINRARIVEYLGDMPAGGGIDYYLTNVHIIDGSHLRPQILGRLTITMCGSRNLYSGTFGTNGFYLDFSQ